MKKIALAAIGAACVLGMGASARAQGQNPEGVNPEHYECYQISGQVASNPGQAERSVRCIRRACRQTRLSLQSGAKERPAHQGRADPLGVLSDHWPEAREQGSPGRESVREPAAQGNERAAAVRAVAQGSAQVAFEPSPDETGCARRRAAPP